MGTVALAVMLLAASFAAWAERPVVKGSLTLNDAVATALRVSPLLKEQTAELAAARARMRQAVAATKLIASTTSTLTTASEFHMVSGPQSVQPMAITDDYGPLQTFNQNVTVTYPLYTGGKLKDQVTAAASLVQAAQADQETVRQEVILETRIAYRRAAYAQSVVGIYEALVKEQQERLRIDQTQYEVGKVPRVNVIRDQADLADAQQKLTDASRDRDIALVDMKAVMGVDMQSDFTLSDPLAPTNLTPDGKTLQVKALASRPELQSAVRRVHAAEAQVRVARSTYKPQVDAFGASNWRAQRAQTGETGGDYILGVIASLSILDGGARHEQVAEAQAMLERARQDQERLTLMVTKEVETAFLQHGAATRNLKTAQSAIEAAEENYRIAQLRYTAGKAIYLEPLDALAALVRARSNYIQALFEQNVAHDALERAAGSALTSTR